MKNSYLQKNSLACIWSINIHAGRKLICFNYSMSVQIIFWCVKLISWSMKKLTTQFHNGNWIFRNVRDFNLDKEKKRMIKNKNHELIMGFIMLESKWGCQANLKYYLIMAQELFWYVHYGSHLNGDFFDTLFPPCHHFIITGHKYNGFILLSLSLGSKSHYRRWMFRTKCLPCPTEFYVRQLSKEKC